MQNKSVFMLSNILLPLLAGASLYVISSPNVIFLRYFKLRVDVASEFINVYIWFWPILRNYIPDMLWGYSLVFAVYMIIDNNAASMRMLIYVLVFSIFLELLQLLPTVPGTFDLLDMLVEGVAEILAVIIIKKYEEASET